MKSDAEYFLPIAVKRVKSKVNLSHWKVLEGRISKMETAEEQLLYLRKCLMYLDNLSERKTS